MFRRGSLVRFKNARSTFDSQYMIVYLKSNWLSGTHDIMYYSHAFPRGLRTVAQRGELERVYAA